MRSCSLRLACVLAALVASSCSRREASPSPPLAPVPAVPPQPAAASPSGQDFAEDARRLYRVVACAGDDPLPPSLDAATVEEHCRALRPRMEAYRQRYLSSAAPFLAAVRPR